MSGMKDKRVVVTGGSGFIGSHLVKRLLEQGAKVAVTMRYGNVMKNERLREEWTRIKVIEADLRNRGALDEVAKFDPQVVFHLAAYNHVGESFRQVEECFDVNAKGTANLLDVVPGTEAFVYMSTSEVYGHQSGVPFVETMNPEPISPYAITKYSGELYCRMKQRMKGSGRIVVLRPFNAYGPYQSSKAIIPELIINCLKGKPIRTTKGEQTREFNYVGNLVDGLLAAAEHTGTIEGPVNLASGEEVAIRDLVKKIAALTNTKSSIEIGALEYRPTEIWRMFADSSRARSLFGWTPRVSLDEGLARTVEWYRQYLASGGSHLE
ncbi:SDR family NAD(P)-dependent oxidoreductase [Archangium violaceum]|uniref:NAD-dependent epimerase/dehydratase family protein n=1 Tax=Archangium violaceum TaxID=83451 RepID=UPI001951FEB7|nr:SDR family NAD(P)-dependent oxidoreductase [Archangium violaceum]QRN95948.1 SDR family NAD(P)-dependent oxidoreductase [Archangium violaceum]